MTRKKGKLMTFLWSLIPGAGEMYLGFFKTGVSLMAAFVILLSLSGFLQLNVLSLLAPVVWFYSFFHANNINALPDDEFYALEDDYLVHMEDIRKNSLFFKTHRKFTAACLICFGISVLWSNLYRLLFSHLLPIIALPEQAEEILYSLASAIPQSVVAVAVIAAGILLLRSKLKELNGGEDETSQPAPESHLESGRSGIRLQPHGGTRLPEEETFFPPSHSNVQTVPQDRAWGNLSTYRWHIL